MLSTICFGERGEIVCALSVAQIPRGLMVSPHCAQCPCARNGQPFRPVPAHGMHGGLCIVGEGPGTNEQLQGYPFVGESGRVVNKAFAAAGIDRVSVFIANALLCKRPADEDFPQAVACCRARLQADLQAAQPLAICALGGTAMRALELPVTSVSEARGTVQWSSLLPHVPVIGTIHPAALLRGGAGEMTKGGKQKMNVDAQAMFLFADIAKAAKVAAGIVSTEWSDDIQVVSEAFEVQSAMAAILEDVYECGMLGLDLEWVCEGSLNPLDALGASAHRALITWVGVGCMERAVSFKWEALLAGTTAALATLQLAMEDENLPKLSHNKQADRAVWEAQVGPVRGRYLDSMLMHHVAFPGIDHDLQQVASQFLCVPPWKVEHARVIAEAKVQQRVEAKQARLVEKERKKADRVAEHEVQNAAKKAEALARKAQRQIAHETRNAALKAEKASRKVRKREQLVLKGVQ
jgi:uracil-DNA glycosylase family 4